MATYVITINEKTSLGKSLIDIIKGLGVKLEKISAKSLQDSEMLDKVKQGEADIKAGKGKAIASEDFWK